MSALNNQFPFNRAALKKPAMASEKEIPLSKYALLLILPGWLLAGCCPKESARTWPNSQVYLDKLNASSIPIDIRVEDSLVSNFPSALMVFGVGAAQGKIDLLHTRLYGAKLIGPGSGVKVTCK
jgi:hypothetical protein